MAVAILYYLYTLAKKKCCSSCTYTRYEMEHFSGHGYGMVDLNYVQNVLWNQNS